MPVTRSQLGQEAREAVQEPENSSRTDTTDVDTIRPREGEETNNSRAASHISKVSRKKRERQSTQRLNHLRLKQIEALMAIEKARLEHLQSASASDEEDEIEDELVHERTADWLDRLQVPEPHREGERNIHPSPIPPHEEEQRMADRDISGRGQGAGATSEPGPRDTVVPPARTETLDISTLTAALRMAARTREAPRYMQELPVFGGHCSMWLSIKAAFEETKECFSKGENVARLRKCLKGVALEAVNSLMLGPPEPEKIMAALEQRFGRPEALILSEMNKLRALAKVTDSPRDICTFASKVANVTATIEAIGRPEYLHNPEITQQIVEKLTPTLRGKWYDFASQNKNVPAMKKMSSFLNEEADKCGPYAAPELIETTQKNDSYRENIQRKERSYTVEEGKHQCPMCEHDHQLTQCKRFQEAEIDQRWETAKKHRLCFKCLKGVHSRYSCRERPCGIDRCKALHHRLLHNKEQRVARTESPPLREERHGSSSRSEQVNANTGGSMHRCAYLKIAPITIFGPSAKMDTYALLDEGSTVTLIDTTVADLMNIEGPSESIDIHGIGGARSTQKYSRKIDLQIKGKGSNKVHILKDVRTMKELVFTAQTIGVKELESCRHLDCIKNDLMYENAIPTLLIGQDNWDLIVSRRVRTGQRDQPVASLTKLGWVLHGCRTSWTKPVTFCGHLTKSKEMEMEDLMNDYFSLESLGIQQKKPRSDPEVRALTLLEERSHRQEDGRFETGLLWKEDDVIIPCNFGNAHKRLLSLEKKLDRNSELKEQYTERLQNMLDAGYAEKVTTQPSPNKTWYLPHFAVVNPAKPKIRVVHDAAAKTAGRSLNDMLLQGPDLLQSLLGIIMRFRQYPYAVSADIKEMFMQIKIREEDRDALRFLWRGSKRGDTPPDELRMTSVIFGAKSSPSTALFIKNKNAAEHSNTYPRAAKAIERNHYMDDYIISFKDKKEASIISKEVDFIHKQAGFELRGWVSNEQDIIRDFTNLGGNTVAIGGSQEEKTLGLLWDVKRDSLGFCINMSKTPAAVKENERAPTKREALSVIMSLFDPLGLISPITTPAKCIMQDTWKYGTGWDEPIPEILRARWAKWMATLLSIGQLRIPRCYEVNQIVNIELHTFVDASEEAYAAAIYWRMQRADGSTKVALATAKSRVTPLKPISIPRLELQAAVLGVRLANTTAQEHDFTASRKVYWSDSKTALAWIRAEPRTFKTFVAHRLAEIEETTKKEEWRWVPTSENVADDSTRGVPMNFDATHRWYRGPSFLHQSEDAWPAETKTTPEKTGEEREQCCATEICAREMNAHLPDINRFSRWQRLIRTTARVFQFIELCRPTKQLVAVAKQKSTKTNIRKDPDWFRHKKKPENPPKKASACAAREKFHILDAKQLMKAERAWIAAVQEECFAKEKKQVIQGERPESNDRLAHLTVFIDESKLLRIRGRIAAATDVNDDTVNPIVLDGTHRYVKLYIQRVHEELHHGGTEIVVNEMRQRLWVLRLRPTVREVIRSCMVCRLRKAKPIVPTTGDLPGARLAHGARPFTFTGVDYFGPLEVTVNRHREKRYVALFTCLTSRAVHLEVAASLSADSAISALRRFIARRGCPREIWSDNGTCFRGADRELQEAAIAAFREEAPKHRIQWCFLPPAAPFMGGAWERMVRTVKTALSTTLLEQYPSDETLCTLLAEVEATVNSRPLTHVGVTPEDPEALTPNHILLGANCHMPAPGEFGANDLMAGHQWRRAQRLADVFWRRWLREYLPLLQHRNQTRTMGNTPKIDDIVLICDPNLPRNTWPRGRVTKVFPGRDGEARVVEIITARGTIMRRPTRRVVVLPIEAQNAPGGEC